MIVSKPAKTVKNQAVLQKSKAANSSLKNIQTTAKKIVSKSEPTAEKNASKTKLSVDSKPKKAVSAVLKTTKKPQIQSTNKSNINNSKIEKAAPKKTVSAAQKISKIEKPSKAKTVVNPKIATAKKIEAKTPPKKPAAKNTTKIIESVTKKLAAKTVKTQPENKPRKVAAKEILKPKAVKKVAAKISPAKEFSAKKIVAAKSVNSRKPAAKVVFEDLKPRTKTAVRQAKPVVKSKLTVKNPVPKNIKTPVKVTVKKVVKTTVKKVSVQNKTPAKVRNKVKSIPAPTKNALLKSLIAESAKKSVPRISKKKAAKVKIAPQAVVVEQNAEAQSRRKIIRAIGSAIFRGIESQYDFKVYAINEIPKQEQAVYIISRRVIDRRKRGHHKLVCIGQTNSIRESLKKHKKENCIKKHDANVICIMPEADEQMRRKIEADLKAAHSIACNHR